MLCSPIESSRFYDRVLEAVVIEDLVDVLLDDEVKEGGRVEEGTHAMTTRYSVKEDPGGNQAYQLPDFLSDCVGLLVLLGHQQSCYML